MDRLSSSLWRHFPWRFSLTAGLVAGLVLSFFALAAASRAQTSQKVDAPQSSALPSQSDAKPAGPDSAADQTVPPAPAKAEGASAASSDDEDDDDETDSEARSSATLTVALAANGSAGIDLSVFGATSEPQDWNAIFRETFGCALRRTGRVSSAKYITFEGKACSLVPRRSGLQFQGQIRLATLSDALRAAGVNQMIVLVMQPGRIPLTCSPRPERLAYMGSSCQYLVLLAPEIAATSPAPAASKFSPKPLPATAIPRIDIAYGMSSAEVARAGIALAIVLVIPVLITLWMRSKAIVAAQRIASGLSGEIGARSAGVPHDDRAGIWFGYWRSLHWVLNGSLALWWAASDAVNFNGLMALGLGLAAPEKSDWLFRLGSHVGFWIPPLLVAGLCQTLSHPVQVTVRGLSWTRSEVLKQSIWTLAAGWLPVLLFFTGIEEIAAGDQRLGALWLGVAFFGRAFLARKSAAAQGLIPHALTAGELRDHIFSLAGKLGVKLTQVYVLTTGKARMANAFARSGNSILLTDTLLESLNRHEVDAVIAHELSHLKHKHPQKLMMAWLGGLAITIAMITRLPSMGALDKPVRYCLILLAPSAFVYLFSRRFEYTADRSAAKLTGDGEAQITSLVKIHRLNLMPLDWGRVQGKFLTHPSTLHRAQSIARATGISDARVPEILAEAFRGKSEERPAAVETTGGLAVEATALSTAVESTTRQDAGDKDLQPERVRSEIGVATLEPPAPEAEANRPEPAPAASPSSDASYKVPSSIANDSKVFSTTYKQRTAFRNAWVVIAAFTFPPGLVAFVARESRMPWGHEKYVLLAGWALTLALSLILGNNLRSWESKALRSRLLEKLQGAGFDPAGWGGRYVGFSPHEGPRIYEGQSVWDIGFLFVYPDRLCYCGDSARFSLSRDQITSIELAAGPASWISSKSVYISWQKDSRSGTFNLRAGDAKSMREMARLTRLLADRLIAWRDSVPAYRGLPPALAELGAPPAGKVTVAGSGKWLRIRAVIRTSILLGFVAWGVSMIFGFPAFGILMPLSYLTLLSAPSASRLMANEAVFSVIRNYSLGVYIILTAWTVYWIHALPTLFRRDPILRKN